MNTAKDRFLTLYEYLVNNKIVRNQQHFCDVVETNKTDVSLIKTGRKNPSDKLLRKVCESYDFVSPQWLLVGEGEMLTRQPTLSDIRAYKDEQPFEDGMADKKRSACTDETSRLLAIIEGYKKQVDDLIRQQGELIKLIANKDATN